MSQSCPVRRAVGKPWSGQPIPTPGCCRCEAGGVRNHQDAVQRRLGRLADPLGLVLPRLPTGPSSPRRPPAPPSTASAPATDGLFGLLALDDLGQGIGMANCVVHASTWSRQPKCYLEDLFVGPRRPGPRHRAAPCSRPSRRLPPPTGADPALLAHPAVQRAGSLPL